jgi:hypothetical protein
MRKEGVERVSPKHFFVEKDRQELEAADMDLTERRRRLDRQDRVLTQLTWLFGGLTFFTLLIILFHGFRFLGFVLEENVIMMLGLATVGEVAGLLAITLNALYQIRQE